MRLLFLSFILIVISFVMLSMFFIITQGKQEIEEIQSPPLFIFKNPFYTGIHNIKNKWILQKVLSETKIYGESPFLLDSVEKFFEVKYYFDITKANYYLKEIYENYWWGKKQEYYLVFENNIFYYIPHVSFVENCEDDFGKALLKVLSGKTVELSKDIYNDKIKMLILKRYGVVIK